VAERSSVEREVSGSFPLRGAFSVPGLLVQLARRPVLQTGKRGFDSRTGHRVLEGVAKVVDALRNFPCHTLP
jgi:hypothetical protein